MGLFGDLNATNHKKSTKGEQLSVIMNTQSKFYVLSTFVMFIVLNIPTVSADEILNPNLSNIPIHTYCISYAERT